jgi:hypothetical protein
MKGDKYGDDEKYESWADNNIFFPLTKLILDPLYCIGLTPNMITLLSTICIFISTYMLYNGNRLTSLFYFIGYLLDCVDGRMAREYNMGTKLGMVLDLVSDNITNIILIIVLIIKYGINLQLLILIILIYLLGISYGLNEAIANYKDKNNDNYFKTKEEMLKNDKGIIYDIFLFVTKQSYNVYRTIFPTYDENKINMYLSKIKEFGPGNICLLITIYLYYLTNKQ